MYETSETRTLQGSKASRLGTVDGWHRSPSVIKRNTLACLLRPKLPMKLIAKLLSSFTGRSGTLAKVRSLRRRDVPVHRDSGRSKRAIHPACAAQYRGEPPAV